MFVVEPAERLTSQTLDLNATDIAEQYFDHYCQVCVHPKSCLFSDLRKIEVDFKDDMIYFIYVKNEGWKRKRDLEEEVERFYPTLFEPLRKLNKTDENKKFVEFYIEIENESQLSYLIPNLADFSLYTINITACRKSLNEVDPCGGDASVQARTLKNNENDLITMFDAQGVSSVDSKQSLKVTWNVPSKPNGELVSYTIRYKKTDDKRSEYGYFCIKHDDDSKEKSHIIGNLSDGEYIVQIAARTTAGMGNYTAEKKVQIPFGRIIPPAQ